MSPPIERVVLALDATAESDTAIKIAVRLAAHAQVRLHALFVEDEDLLTLASLPIAREVVPGAGAGLLRTQDVELQLRAAATRAEEDMLVAARSHALDCSFEIVRGAAQTAFSLASERDLVVAAAHARPVAGHFRVESRWLEALALAPGPLLLTKGNRDKHSGIVVLLRERGGQSARLLHAAGRLAELEGGKMIVICPPAVAAAPDFGEWVAEQIAPATAPPQIEPAPGNPAALQARIAELDCGLLALDATAAGRGQLAEVARRFPGDVLVAN